ncbi:TIGR04283 family arsenosugar biosynthesis glycosyltransferase [Pontimicrobium sp. IMCC45349]|uniref:TIGR04283 family arsenosugar biosynthesis glycosyltransferase n=1 Tax=Pontimicrobium sp. IMCC45349 TaxID=3391574 RepID=UPI00399F3E73
MNNISIIIPVLNEEATITKLLLHLKTHAITKSVIEVIIVDGGSTDHTIKLAKKGGATVLSTTKGRAKQMNHGVKYAKGDILYFLHADSLPPLGFDESILNQTKKAGCFKMKFNSNHWWLKLAGWLTQFNWRASRGGDQSLFVSKDIFNQLGGYDEAFTIYEDIDFINKLYKINEFTVIKRWITTSARRYNKNGIWKLQRHFWTIYVKKWFGASAKDLHQYYIKHIH